MGSLDATDGSRSQNGGKNFGRSEIDEYVYFLIWEIKIVTYLCKIGQDYMPGSSGMGNAL